MKYEVFRQLFLRSLEVAAHNARQILKREIPVQYEILLHGAGYSGEPADIETAAQILYINEDQFYQVIDLAVIQVSPAKTRIFARISGHPPVPFEKTHHFSEGNGAFKQLIAQIKVIDEAENSL